jgi:hypothetical protein
MANDGPSANLAVLGYGFKYYIAGPKPSFLMATTKKPVPSTFRPTAASTATAQRTAAAAPRQQAPLFGKENYRWMLIGLVLIALGLILMGGGKSKDPNVFNPKEIYSFTRITLAPILILGGFVVEIFAIFRKDKKESQ